METGGEGPPAEPRTWTWRRGGSRPHAGAQERSSGKGKMAEAARVCSQLGPVLPHSPNGLTAPLPLIPNKIRTRTGVRLPCVCPHYFAFQVQAGAPLWGPYSGTLYTSGIYESQYNPPHGSNIQWSVNSLLSQTCTPHPTKTRPLHVPLGHQTQWAQGQTPWNQGTPFPRGLVSSLSLATSLSAHWVCKVNPLGPLISDPPSTQATVTPLTCDNALASEPASSLPKSHPSPLTSPKNQQPVQACHHLQPSDQPEPMLF